MSKELTPEELADMRRVDDSTARGEVSFFDFLDKFETNAITRLLETIASKDAEIARLQNLLNATASKADDIITLWEMSHNGRLIFGEHWRIRLKQVFGVGKLCG